MVPGGQSHERAKWCERADAISDHRQNATPRILKEVANFRPGQMGVSTTVVVARPHTAHGKRAHGETGDLYDVQKENRRRYAHGRAKA